MIGMTKLERYADQLAALGNPVRLQILRLVVQAGEQGSIVGDIQRKLEIPWSTLSHHLDRLAAAGLLAPQPDGRYIHYRADYPALRALTEYLWQDCCKGGNGCC
jgi:DNA-binding transcriptional ArsR family regulator